MTHALIIDDNSRNVQVLQSLLAKQGLTYTGVLDPLDIEEILQTIGKIDVVFLDLEMPGMNGYDVLALIKADSRFQNVPVVACTVHVAEINTAHQNGFHSFLAKPLDSERFPDQLARILKGEPVWERN